MKGGESNDVIWKWRARDGVDDGMLLISFIPSKLDNSRHKLSN